MGNRISSKENRVYKACVRLTRKKYRDREKRYLIEGENLIREALCSGVRIESILVREGAYPEGTFSSEEYTLSEALFDRIAQTETSQGVLAIVEKPEYGPEETARIWKTGSNLVVLDRLQDPGNIGTIIRTAEGAGYAAVLCMRGTADVYSPKVVRAAAGSLFRMPILLAEDEAELIRLAHEHGKQLTVTCFSGAVRYDEAGLNRDIALVIGNEGNGCSETLIESADVRVRIPMNGQLESLNASVAAGILMYEAIRNK
ncbi:MAG: RNA methyltransferase [Eubacterium sp.]|nr:RNA methyltransferase [Eubacterium sp.]